MKTKALLTMLVMVMLLAGCSTKKPETMEPYVIEIVTFKYKPTVDSDTFWIGDAKVQTDYTSKQPGFISRESGYSEDSNEVLVVVRWKTEADADASMQKFMEDESVVDFVNMIEPETMKMRRYNIK